MSSTNSYQCRWNWCRQTCPTILELLNHVNQGHVQKTEFSLLREIPLLVRAEEGTGQSLSGLTIDLSGRQDVAMDASSPDLNHTPEPSSKRQKLMTPSPGSLHNTPNPSLSPIRRTPTFADLSSPEAPAVPNPELPDLDTLIANSIAKKKTGNASPDSWSLESSDDSVERMLTQSIDFDSSFQRETVSANDASSVYAGELNWDDEPSPNLPRSVTTTPTQPQSQKQPKSSTTPPTSIRKRQSWYQSPGRASRPKLHPSPAEILRLNDAPASPTSPTRSYRSGSLKVPSSAQRPNHPNGGTLNPSEIMVQPMSYSQLNSFVPQTQAPYQSQSISQ